MELRELATKVFRKRWVVVLRQRSLPWLDEPWTHSTHTPNSSDQTRQNGAETDRRRRLLQQQVSVALQAAQNGVADSPVNPGPKTLRSKASVAVQQRRSFRALLAERTLRSGLFS